MSYFKKVTDLCALAAAFVVSLFFLKKYMDYTPYNLNEDAPSKLEQFLKPTTSTDYTMLIPLILAFLISFVVSRVFAKLPYICLSASLIPALYTAYMFENGLLYDQKVLVIILCALHVIGNLAECVTRDSEDGHHRLWIGAKITSFAGALFCLYTTKLSDKALPPRTEKKLPLFDTEVISEMNAQNMELITTLGWIFLGLLLISLLLYNVYFIDAILSFIPLIFSIYAAFSDRLTICPAVFITLSAICTAAHLMLAAFENNLSYKEQQKLKEKTA